MSAHLFPDGSALPSPGLGTWKIPEELTPQIVHQAIEAGYRHLDCAADYGNERLVGKGIASALNAGLCARDDLWVTSKLWNTYHEPQHVRAACEKTLSDLGIGQLDLYLIHFPIALEFVPFDKMYPPGWTAGGEAMSPILVPYSDTWRAMEELVDAGLTKRIGVSNIGTAMLREVLSYARIKPAVLQVEMHPCLCQENLLRFCQEQDVAVTAFSPFGADSYLPLGMAEASERILAHPVLERIAAAHGKSTAQVALRWAMQRGTIPIPKTQSPDHLRENFDIFEFVLTPEELTAISDLDQHKRFNDPAVFGEKAFNTFFPIFD
ncbi:aldo/keto reductase [Akkermansiaceae bacterium]|jgi:diketogulonate reductase-like aldo/keto reductase|nr:aldo/keto reductase [Akkermansiaceae bacterium]MDB4465150.1 aldo/keto reductase [Akkermansiaceae bacterium]MDB4466202.1 aldo/keto reductase [bacterium]MDF1713448.1 aldo/keto reductase [Akkermansiaceae bacterium]